jgi:hypothetical protein
MRNGGVLRAVAKVEQLQGCTMIALECGHLQQRPKTLTVDVPKRVICFPCAATILGRAKEAMTS